MSLKVNINVSTYLSGTYVCECTPYDNLKLLTSNNLITLDDFSGKSDIQGKTTICGSILGDDSNVFGGSLNSFPVKEYALEILKVPQGASTSVKLQQGSADIGCTGNAVSYISGIQYLVNKRPFEIAQYNLGARLDQTCTLKDKCQILKTKITALSSTLSKLIQEPGNKIGMCPDVPNRLLIEVKEVDCNNVAVFCTSYDQTIGLNGLSTIELRIAPDLTDVFVIINIEGQQITWPSGLNLVGQWFDSNAGRTSTLWNYPSANKVTYHAAVKGYTLAPGAKLDLRVNTEGSVAVDKLEAIAQVHLPNLKPPACVQ